MSEATEDETTLVQEPEAAAAPAEPEAAPEPATAAEAASEPEPVPAPEAAPEPEPEKPAEPRRVRQWVNLRNSSMDVRAGRGICASVAHDLRSAIGKPHGCAVVHEASAPEAVIDQLRLNLSDQGFSVHEVVLAEAPCDLAAVSALDAELAERGITADDLVVAVGGFETLSLASFACASWCGGVSLAEVPLDLASAIEAGTTPRSLDLPGLPRMVAQLGSARFSLVDADLYDCDPAGEGAQHAFALMVATAMCDSDKAFGRLWDAADDLAAGDTDALVTQLLDTVKSRGRVVSSTSLATRQSIEYGTSFAHALATLAGPGAPASALLADGLRFAARLAVAEDALSVDDMLTQDELLERLGVGTTEGPVDPEALVRAIKAERYRRTNRLMLGLPRAIGRVRLSVVPDDLLAEHAAAWCATRPGA